MFVVVWLTGCFMTCFQIRAFLEGREVKGSGFQCVVSAADPHHITLLTKKEAMTTVAGATTKYDLFSFAFDNY